MVSTLDAGQKLDRQNVVQRLGHAPQPARTVGGHGYVIFLIGHCGDTVHRRRVRLLAVLGDHGSRGDLAAHEARAEAGIACQEGGQARQAGVHHQRQPAFGQGADLTDRKRRLVGGEGNRSPLAFDIAEHRPEDQADMPVTDSDVRAYLAERWSRSQPKEAALDYITDSEWRDASEGVRASIRTGATRTTGTRYDDPGDGQGEAPEIREAANDNAIVRIANEIRHAVNGWRHGAAVDAFAAERAEVMVAWDELRQKVRDQGEAVALSPAFRQTLDRHGALMKQAASFGAKPQVFERLLVERAGIGQGEIEKFRKQHARAGEYLRSVMARAAHRARRDATHEEPGIVEAIAAETAALTAERAPEPLAPTHPTEVDEVAPGSDRDAPPDWRTLYQELQRDWNDLVARSQEPELPLLLMDGYDALIVRVRALAEHPELSERARTVLDMFLDYHDDETLARETAEGYLAAAERHVEAYKALERHAGERGVPVARLDAWSEWREAAEMLAATGKAVLANEDRYGAYLDVMTIGKARARLTVEQLRSRLRENRARVTKPKAQQPRRGPTPKQAEGFAHTLDEPRMPRTQRGRTGQEEQQGFAHRLDRPPARPPGKIDREKGFAHILDDPEKLKELRERVEKEERKLGRHMHRSRGLSM